MELFEQLRNAQMQHDEEGVDKAEWENPLRYSLTLFMAHKKHRLDRGFKLDVMASLARSILEDCSSRTGLYPGQLKPSTKEPTLFFHEIDRDPHFHCGFEIPYILLRVSGSSGGHEHKPVTTSDQTFVTESSGERPLDIHNDNSIQQDNTNYKRGDSGAPKDVALTLLRILKRRNLHGRLVDNSNIVEVLEEWLYKVPDFLNYEVPELAVLSIIMNGQLLLGNKASDPETIVSEMKNNDKSCPRRYTFVEDQDIDKKRDVDENGNVHKDIRYWRKFAKNTKEIIAEVETNSGQSQNDTFNVSNERLEDKSVKDLQENLASLREVIDQWNVRESTQGRERSRWTLRDDQKYGKTIKQKHVLFESHVRDVRTKEIDVEFLLGRVDSAQEAIRSQKSLTEAQNITLFTYVTVLFLPAGLAVSIFSMADAPSGRVLGWMILTAVVALLIRVMVLYGVIHKFRNMLKGRPGETRSNRKVAAKALKNQDMSEASEVQQSPDDNVYRDCRMNIKMNQDTKHPQEPPQSYAPVPPSSSPSHEIDIEAQPNYAQTGEKNPLKTWSQVAQEWKYGSKGRVVTHFCLYFLIGFIIGGIVGIVIGVCVAYA
ncbi:hypothetical protein BDW69DRAFT_189492 [Aspergillus filifer]